MDVMVLQLNARISFARMFAMGYSHKYTILLKTYCYVVAIVLTMLRHPPLFRC